MTDQEILSRIRNKNTFSARSTIKKNDLLDKIQWRMHYEHDYLINVNDVVESFVGQEALKDKISEIFNHETNPLVSLSEFMEWYEDDENEFFLYGEYLSENEFLMKIKLRENNSGKYFKDMDGTATVILTFLENNTYRHDTVFLEDDIALIEKQADIWLERLSKKSEQMVRFVKSLVSSHKDNSADGLHFNEFKTGSDKFSHDVEFINKETNEIQSTSYHEIANELIYLDVDYKSKTILKKQEHLEIMESLIPMLRLR